MANGDEKAKELTPAEAAKRLKGVMVRVPKLDPKTGKRVFEKLEDGSLQGVGCDVELAAEHILKVATGTYTNGEGDRVFGPYVVTVDGRRLGLPA
jgi:hypothetical protein